jgi:hypothetical protein
MTDPGGGTIEEASGRIRRSKPHKKYGVTTPAVRAAELLGAQGSEEVTAAYGAGCPSRFRRSHSPPCFTMR